ncbi:helix-turn-helix domain-containing protein [Faecalibacter bovis]|uniref:DNA-binding protein n=1 Tax=Faecalibacter bovis TaxID=2898187 RepID=A0ABX7XFM3_9FLAO|nr:helix-turn-helix domain-containing protein [Faecalibacter bovis]QTV06617.1 hypothetical protein J9309_04650 [Faecalibacter bovis]
MEKNPHHNTMKTFQQIIVEIDKIKLALENLDVHSMDLVLMEEREVLELLKISRSTLFNYREKKIIKAYNFFGRNIYFKHEIYKVIINQLLH